MDYIKQLKKGNQKALEYVIDTYMPLVKGTVYKILMQFNDKGIIEECINDIFLSIWNNSKKFKSNDEIEFKKWIYKISKFKAIDYYRKLHNKIANVNIDECEILYNKSVEDECINIENKNELIVLINSLNELDRKIMVMKFFMGMKSEDISKRLGLTKSAIDNRIYRSKKALNKKSNVLEVI